MFPIIISLCIQTGAFSVHYALTSMKNAGCISVSQSLSIDKSTKDKCTIGRIVEEWLTHVILNYVIELQKRSKYFFICLVGRLSCNILADTFCTKIRDVRSPQCRNYMSFLSFRFYVKTILRIVEMQNLPF